MFNSSGVSTVCSSVNQAQPMHTLTEITDNLWESKLLQSQEILKRAKIVHLKTIVKCMFQLQNFINILFDHDHVSDKQK